MKRLAYICILYHSLTKEKSRNRLSYSDIPVVRFSFDFELSENDDGEWKEKTMIFFNSEVIKI